MVSVIGLANPCIRAVKPTSDVYGDIYSWWIISSNIPHPDMNLDVAATKNNTAQNTQSSNIPDAMAELVELCGRLGFRFPVQSNQWLSKLIIVLSSQVLGIIRIRQGLASSVSGYYTCLGIQLLVLAIWFLVGQHYKTTMSAHCHKLLSIRMWPEILLGHNIPKTIQPELECLHKACFKG